MNSLKWRIAAAYAGLFVLALAVATVAISMAFRTILLNQAELRAKVVATQIRRTVEPFGLFALGSDQAIAAFIATQSNLESWSSATTLVQIDNAQGQPIGKSSNTGSFIFPPDKALTPKNSSRTYIQGNLFVYDEALVENGHIVAIAHVGERLDAVRETLAVARNILLIASAVAVVVVVLASIGIAALVLNPVIRLTEIIEEIGSEQLGRRIGWSGRKDELGRLAAAFDRMLDRLQAAFARERQFISDASHELKTPLTVINANAQMLRRWADRDDKIRAESLGAIIDESAGLAGMVNGMLLLAKADSGEQIPKEPLDLNRVVRDVAESARTKAETKGLAVSFEPSANGAIVYGSESLLRQLFGNLLDNAIKFTEYGNVGATLRSDDDQVIGEVFDTGPGIDEAALERVFDRFYRADKSRTRAVEGTGLGLAIVQSIARVHGGSVEAAKRPQGGSVFTVRLPREH
ncbi:MAG: HAMP domain-containing histidine kinase [Candidatus Eremiobacteraeota bacterium]|nr:HAMP domain-containing histidine kinase [Candidatus Eremiobacteraeota bacterium]